jgi:hypothetical protein
MADPATQFLQDAGVQPGASVAPIDPASAFLQDAQGQTTAAAPSAPVLPAWQQAVLAAGHNALKPLHGLAQDIEHGVGATVHAVAPGSSADQAVSGVVSGDDAELARNEADYQRQVPDGLVNNAMGFAGGVAPWVVGGVPKALSAAGDLAASGVAKVVPSWAERMASFLAKTGTEGGIIGAAEPVTDGTDFAGQKARQIELGAASGPVAGALGAGVKSVGQVLAPLTNPGKLVGDYLAGLKPKLPDDPSDVWGHYLWGDDLPKQTPVFVPGSKPTTAQVAGSLPLVQAEKSLANSNPEFKGALAQREIDNNAARLNVIKGIAGTDADLQAAKDQRDLLAGPWYDAAKNTSVTPDAALDSILARPSAVEGMKRAARLAAENGEPFVHITPGAPATPASTIVGENGLPLSSGSPAGAATTQYPVNTLHYLKMGLDDMLKDPGQGGIVGHEERAVTGTKNDLLNWLDVNSPEYGMARRIYAAKSQPINDMEAAQGILGAVENKAQNAAGDPVITLPGFNSAFGKAQKADFGMSPHAQNALEGVQNDLQRASISNSIKSPGSDTAYNLQAPGWLAGKIYGPNFEGNSGLAKTIGTLLGAVGGAMAPETMHLGAFAGGYAGHHIGGQVSTMGTAKVNSALADALLDPNSARDTINAAQGIKPSIMGQLLLHGLPPGVALPVVQQQQIPGVFSKTD